MLCFSGAQTRVIRGSEKSGSIMNGVMLRVDCTCIYPQAEILTGLSIKSIDDAKRAVPALLDRGCRRVIITLGGQGSVYASQGDTCPVHVPADVVEPLDSTVSGKPSYILRFVESDE